MLTIAIAFETRISCCAAVLHGRAFERLLPNRELICTSCSAAAAAREPVDRIDTGGVAWRAATACGVPAVRRAPAGKHIGRQRTGSAASAVGEGALRGFA